MIKSPLRYPGGKSRAVDLISSLIPDFDEYREPFLGGGSLFINLKQILPNKVFWINDLYEELYKFWKYSREDMRRLIDKIYEWKSKYVNGKELYKFLKANTNSFNDLETAAYFFIYNRITFSGTSLSGGYSESAFNSRFTESSILRLKNIEEIVKGVKITNTDYEKVLAADGDSVFVFLDPPYFSAKKSALYGKNGDLHKSFDHERFANVMKNCKHKWLITYDNSDYIKNLFSFANVFPWNLTYGMRNVNGRGKQIEEEIFISNYLTSVPRQDALDFFENKNKMPKSVNTIWKS
ncbi:MAG: DNA adenine methylase [Endomicrobium sp.]|jgi:DNA adenine methylase|nr:DNA adenine methylase [Endomicrobium sp.]